MAAQRLRRMVCGVATLLCVCWFPAPHPCAADGGLELRAVRDGSLAEAGSPVPAEAVRVFVYEGMPGDVVVTDDVIAVDYGVSGVLFDRSTGEPLQRLTVADGWPAVRPEPFGPRESPAARRGTTVLVGPGVLYGPWKDDEPELPVTLQELAARSETTVPVGPGVLYGRWKADESELAVAASVAFQEHEWRALQPAGFLRWLVRPSRRPEDRELQARERREQWGAWTPILRAINELSYVEVAAPGSAPARRFTMDDGLASNIVSHLVVAQGSLWAACVDIYDPEREQWGPGGLCRFDPRTMRWERVDRVDGRPVRWVTLLQNVDGELWVGFREGSSVAGDRISYGKGIAARHYRPQATALVLARLAGGQWVSFARPPRPDPTRPYGDPPAERPSEPPTEKPYRLAKSGGKVLLATQNPRGHGWDPPQDVRVSVLDEATGEWRDLDDYEHFAADHLLDFSAERGEIVVRSNRGAHRWDPDARAWQFLDPGCTLRNPNMSAAVAVGDELWVGYTNQAPGVVGEQGISRFHERTGRWSHMLPDETGTACPVRSIVPLPRGDTWVLFRPRPYESQVGESPRYARETLVSRPTGLGRFSDGKWEFPIALPQAAEEGAPQTMYFVRRDAQLAGVGDVLVFGDRTGLYAGPTEWEQVAAGPVLAVEPSPDGRGLSVFRPVPGGDSPDRGQVQRGRYDVDQDTVAFETVAARSPGGPVSWWRPFSLRGYLLSRPPGASWFQRWVHVPVAEDGLWVIGPLGSKYHAVVETPRAVWIASHGELIRLDRKLLPDCVREFGN
jgi:hypothetical protein